MHNKDLSKYCASQQFVTNNRCNFCQQKITCHIYQQKKILKTEDLTLCKS